MSMQPPQHHASPAESGRQPAHPVPCVPSELCLQAKTSSKNASHQTNHFISKKPASKNILQNTKATFKRKSPKTLENSLVRISLN